MRKALSLVFLVYGRRAAPVAKMSLFLGLNIFVGCKDNGSSREGGGVGLKVNFLKGNCTPMYHYGPGCGVGP